MCGAETICSAVASTIVGVLLGVAIAAPFVALMLWWVWRDERRRP